MAYCKTSSTKSIAAAVRYCEKKEGVVVGASGCIADGEIALKQFAAVRHQFGKDGTAVQGHMLIQSFKGTEVTPEEANRIGLETADEIAPGFQKIVFTHVDSDGGNIHNHIIINAVHPETGKKFQDHALLQRTREVSDALCKEHDLSVITTEKAATKYAMAEKALMQKGVQPWKDELREAVETVKQHSRNETEFRQGLAELGVKITERTRKRDGSVSWTYQHPNGMKCRAAKLGDDYSRDGVCREWDMAAEKARQQEAARQRDVAARAARQSERESQDAEKKKDRSGAVAAGGQLGKEDDVDLNDPTISQMTKDEKAWEQEIGRML